MSDLPDAIPVVVARPDRDLIEELAYALEASVDKDGWDQNPRMFSFQRGDPVGDMAALYATEGPPMPDIHVGQFCDVFAASIVADAIAGRGEPRYWDTLASWQGIGLVFETWAVVEPDDPQAKAKLREDRAARRLHLREDRTESRICIVVMADSREAGVERHRGEEPEAGQMTGKVLVALHRLMGAVVFSALARRGLS